MTLMTMTLRQRAAKGFTLIELMVVVSMIAVLSTLAMPSLVALASNQTLSNSASDLLSAVLQARSSALKENRRVLVQPTSNSNWSSGWIIYIDVDKSATYDSSVDTLLFTKEPLSSDIAIGSLSGSGESSNSASLFGFDGDGFLANVSGNYDGSVLMKSNKTGKKKYIVVSRVGRGRLCDPSQTPGCEP